MSAEQIVALVGSIVTLATLFLTYIGKQTEYKVEDQRERRRTDRERITALETTSAVLNDKYNNLYGENAELRAKLQIQGSQIDEQAEEIVKLNEHLTLRDQHLEKWEQWGEEVALLLQELGRQAPQRPQRRWHDVSVNNERRRAE